MFLLFCLSHLFIFATQTQNQPQLKILESCVVFSVFTCLCLLWTTIISVFLDKTVSVKR